MHNKISTLVLSLFVTGHCLALELTPGEIMIPQHATQQYQCLGTIPLQPTHAPVAPAAFINTAFGKIISQFEEDKETSHYTKLELILKQTVFDHGVVIAPLTAVAIPLVLALLPSNIPGTFALAGTFGLSQVTIMCRNNKGQTDSIFYKHAHDTAIHFEKDEHGDWKVVNSIYDEETNKHLSLVATALEKGEGSSELYAPLEKIFNN